MAWRIERKRGKDVIVLDTRPTKRVRRARQRIEKRQREINEHFKTTQKTQSPQP